MLQLLKNQLVKANKKVMRKQQQLCSLKSKIKAEHKKQKVKPEKGVQCNTLQREINDLHAEIDLYIDENNNIQSDAASNTTVFEARSTDKGGPYNSNFGKFTILF
jgi:predicted  nucleic acid-binding Zn-ribbon protein